MSLISQPARVNTSAAATVIVTVLSLACTALSIFDLCLLASGH